MTDIAQKIAEKHNAGLANSPPAKGDNLLKSYVARLRALEESKAEIAEDIRELKKEAKEHDLDPKALATVVKHQMEDAEKREKRIAHEEQVDAYKSLLGVLD